MPMKYKIQSLLLTIQ